MSDDTLPDDEAPGADIAPGPAEAPAPLTKADQANIVKARAAKAKKDQERRLAAEAAKQPGKVDPLLAAARARPTAGNPPGASPPGIAVPKPMVELADPRKNPVRDIPKPTLQVQDPSAIGTGYEEELPEEAEEEAAAPAPAPRKQNARPVKKKKVYTAEQQKLLAQIKKESEARVDIDDFLANKDKDQFHVPAHLIPDGFAVEWKNTHVGGKPMDGTYVAMIESAGWRPAPSELFRELVPEGYDKPTIEKGASMLYIRPAHISEAIKEAEYQAAIGQVQDKMASLTQAPNKAASNPRFVQQFSREYEARRPVMQDK